MIDQHDALADPCSFEVVQQKEREFIREVRNKTLRSEQSGYVGLSLSGGGIRSAAFQLGVLQAFATHGLLNIIDYLSTVSGGGYVGGWFVKWLQDETSKKPGSEKNAAIESLKITPGRPEADRIRWLRKHSNYLTPHVGVFRHDSIFLATTYVHSLIFNFLVIFAFLSGIMLLIPRSALGIVMSLGRIPALLEIGGGGLALGSLFLVLLRMVYTGHKSPKLSFVRHVSCAVCLVATLFAVRRSIFPRWTAWLTIIVVLMLLFCKKDDGRFGIPQTERLVRVSLCSAVIFLFFIPLDFVGLSPHWPEIGVFAWFWAAPVDNWFETSTVSRRVRRWVKTLPAAVGAFAITAFMIYRTDSYEFQMIGRPHYKEISALLHGGDGKGIALGIVLLLGCLFFMFALTHTRTRLRKMFRLDNKSNVSTFFRLALAAVFTASVSVVSLFQYLAIFRSIGKVKPVLGNATPLHVIAIMTPLCIVVGTLQFSLTVALLGGLISPAKRERIWGDCTTMYRSVLAWIGIAVIGIYAPALISTAPPWLRLVFAVLWFFSLVVAFLHIRFTHINKRTQLFSTFVLETSTLAFFLGLLILVSLSDDKMTKIENTRSLFIYFNEFARSCADGATWVYGIVTIVLSGLLMALLDVNHSSMHYFFQGRVARAFLLEELPGSKWTLDPRSAADKMLGPPIGLHACVPEEGYRGPLPIFNAALNLGVTNVLDWQERKAANFIFTPYFSGYDVDLVAKQSVPDDGQDERAKRKGFSKFAYAHTKNYKYGQESGIRLAAAMAISGSAIGSAMGSLTSIKTRVLHTLLNLRLGWWFPNPRVPSAWNLGGLPQWWTVLKEFLGWADAEGSCVHLSDGGHFENLGLYELVKRKCKVIIVSDASEDREATFKCLSLAIQKCRVDFNYTISLDIVPLSPTAAGFSERAFVMGTIDYGKDAERGSIVYLRPAITDHQSTDVIALRRADGFFPHHPTINQWFSESLFESYRELGQCAAESWIDELKPGKTSADLIQRCEAMCGRGQRAVATTA